MFDMDNCPSKRNLTQLRAYYSGKTQTHMIYFKVLQKVIIS